jgi:hypothetical protein
MSEIIDSSALDCCSSLKSIKTPRNVQCILSLCSRCFSSDSLRRLDRNLGPPLWETVIGRDLVLECHTRPKFSSASVPFTAASNKMLVVENAAISLVKGARQWSLSLLPPPKQMVAIGVKRSPSLEKSLSE